MGLKVLGAVVAFLAACGAAAAGLVALSGHNPRPAVVPVALAAGLDPPAPRYVTTTTSSTTVPPTTTSTTVAPPAPVQAVLAGCPVPPQPPSPAPPPPWHPANLVPDSSLPALAPPAPWHSSLAAISGKGMWIWLWSATDGGDPGAIIKQAQGAGLHQLWVRVGDSKNGFYGASELAALVPAAHAAGISVVAWGFPYLYDPVGDAAWTSQILAWRAPTGDRVDAYSADLERQSEGVAMTALRAGVYLQAVRRSADTTPIVATVYPPLDQYWSGDYPYKTMATYVDAFAPMVYWECSDPGGAAAQAISRLSALRPVHVIGQAFNMADVHGRVPAPSGAEITEFLSEARRAGAVGASFWVWQTATAEEWNSVSNYRW